MSQENVEIVLRLYQGMNVGDVTVAEELIASDAEWIPDSRVGEGPIQGRENVIRFFADRAEMFDEFRHEVERSWDLGDRVLLFTRHTGRGRGSGAEFEIRIAHLWTLRDGIVVRGEGYGDRDQALGAAGLRE